MDVSHHRQRVDSSCGGDVVSVSIEPAARWLESGLQRLGVQNLKPRTLHALAENLAGAGIGGLVSLTGPGDHLLAAATLSWSPRSTATPIGPSSAASRATTAPAPTR